jgi:EAL domain-containing protein (putative c-di-GMP-specific phosphodiesterase class I)
VAEQTGQILQIGAWYLRTAADMVVACQTALPHNWMVSVRLSERQLCDEILLSQLAETLEATGLSPGRLEIELGEALLPAIDIDMLLTLSAIRDLGIGLTLDEFGTGFASLSALKRLPLTAIKLHRSLIRHLPRDREDAAVVRALIEAGHALGFDIIADGIETESQRAFLSASGCDTGQGALFSPLLPPTQFRDWITRP